ncbi:Sec-independent protein translocase subunit TatA/TatB [Pontibacter arcticus]|uniref:Sec-independent protein translocase protein TatA n=1 Tax=Pontibacter arcticus TaxID=2080288 RepID=A0A364RCJ8_9BACT|nr:twin-arginine translocase TatA/TatE family subunit [Pontibacter arcticus]RAU82080.1 twin-arginine translocase TatA/TatE family subunit [Pontibacter arcticus]
MNLHTAFLFLGDIGGGELFIIITAVLLLFGADKIPGIARSMGRGIREFKDATNEIKHELERSIEDDKPKKV